MKRSFDVPLILAAVLAGGLGFGVAHYTTAVRPTQAGTEPGAVVPASLRPAEAAPAATLGGMVLPDFADIAERANPAVVAITSTESADRGRAPEDPYHWFFPFRRPPGRGIEQRSMGSGFLISEDGFILTNNHVVANSKEIQVKLTDETTYEAKVVGRDPELDLALVRIETDRKTPALPLGDSDRARPGEWVCAIGNPLLYEHTVTVGVVSAKGRQLDGDRGLASYIQTDAAINFGNSGGPLLNTRGEVIGINTAISSQGQNIGFAVPINLVKEILSQLRERGRVARGYLGVDLQDIEAGLRRKMDVPDPGGVLIATVREGSAAAAAGLERGDVILEVDGEPIGDSQALVRRITRRAPGEVVRLKTLRERETREVRVTLGARPARDEEAAQQAEESAPDESQARLGVKVSDLLPRVLRSFRIPEGTEGVVVIAVDPDGPAGQGQLQEGDVILEVDRQPVASVVALERTLRDVEPDSDVLLYVMRGGKKFFSTVTAAGS